jgi:hypothetical protein
MKPLTAECEFRDKNMSMILDLLEQGYPGIRSKHSNFVKPKLTYGLRGTRYFLEFPILAINVDTFQYIVNTEKAIRAGKK